MEGEQDCYVEPPYSNLQITATLSLNLSVMYNKIFKLSEYISDYLIYLLNEWAK